MRRLSTARTLRSTCRQPSNRRTVSAGGALSPAGRPAFDPTAYSPPPPDKEEHAERQVLLARPFGAFKADLQDLPAGGRYSAVVLAHGGGPAAMRTIPGSRRTADGCSARVLLRSFDLLIRRDAARHQETLQTWHWRLLQCRGCMSFRSDRAFGPYAKLAFEPPPQFLPIFLIDYPGPKFLKVAGRAMD